jgi:hypothetical protein
MFTLSFQPNEINETENFLAEILLIMKQSAEYRLGLPKGQNWPCPRKDLMISEKHILCMRKHI